MELTFLQGYAPLVKVFTDQGVNTYPRVRSVTSYTAVAPSILQLEQVLFSESEKGVALHTGNLSRQLSNESRKGAAVRNGDTSLFIIDVDKMAATLDITVPLTQKELQAQAERIIAHLPDVFKNVSYLAQASASAGLKGDEISMHLYFYLKNPASPKALNNYVAYLNTSIDFFKNQMELTKSELALSYPLDKVVNAAGRLIYIARPKFVGAQTDPWKTPLDRFVTVEKDLHELPLDSEMRQVSAEAIAQKEKKLLKELRNLKGLGARTNKEKTIQEDDDVVRVVINPGRMNMTFADDQGDFVAYNINGGDSRAYWVYKKNPTVVRNFKNEPFFLFEKADPDAYAWHVKTFNTLEHMEAENGLTPLAFQDLTTARYFYGLVDKKEDALEMLTACSGMEKVNNFCLEYGAIPPENLPVWKYRFDPHDPKVCDWDNQTLNQYSTPSVIRHLPSIDEKYYGVGIGYGGEAIKELCPTIYKIIASVCGFQFHKPDSIVGVEDMELFLNWLAFVLQEKRKTSTAWVFHGVPGSGKGVMLHHILKPLVGEPYVAMKRVENMRDQFNGWLERCLLCAIDEFKIDGTKTNSELINKMKNYITEPFGTIRMMHTDQMERELFANFILFSNDQDAVLVQEDDRRFNIAPRQQRPLLKNFPDLFIDDAITKLCKSELPNFAALMMNYKYDAKRVLETRLTDAKVQMIKASQDAADEFCDAVREGDLDFFIPILDAPPFGLGQDYTSTAQTIMRSLLRDYEEGQMVSMFNSELRAMYNVLIAPCDKDIQFGKILSKRGINTEPVRKNSRQFRGVKIPWRLKFNDLETLQNDYLKHDIAEVLKPKSLGK